MAFSLIASRHVNLVPSSRLKLSVCWDCEPDDLTRYVRVFQEAWRKIPLAARRKVLRYLRNFETVIHTVRCIRGVRFAVVVSILAG